MENIETSETVTTETASAETVTSENASEANKEANVSEQGNEADKKQKRLRRGSAPPGLSLGEAIEIATRLYEEAGGESFYDLLSRITENSPGSSVFARKLIALRNYGLVEVETRADSKVIKLTEIGLSITAPKSEAEKAEALKLAFLKIEVFAKLYEKFKGRLLPQDLFFVNTVAEYVPKEIAREWLERFKQSASTANLLEDRGDGKTLVLETLHIPEQKRQPKPEIKAEQVEERQPQQAQPQPVLADVIRMPIALGPGRLAHIELPKDWNPTELKKLLALLKLSLGEDTEIGE